MIPVTPAADATPSPPLAAPESRVPDSRLHLVRARHTRRDATRRRPRRSYNANGQLGLGDTTDRGRDAALMGDALPFVNLGTGRSIKYVGVHTSGGCALDEASSSVLCWGAAPQHGLDVLDVYGDNATRMGDALPVVNLGTGAVVKALSVGYERSCAILDTATVTGGVKCWVSSPRAPFGCTTVALSRD